MSQKLKNITVTANIQNAIVEFCSDIRAKLKNNVLELRLFGSVARGDNTPESDIDILVLIKNKNKATEDIIYDAAFEASLKHDVVISPIIRTHKEYTYPLFQETLYYKKLQEEGFSL
ncbi:nucleotidyltransferase domain-containing protein [Desulfoscipio sp. XC116]|uniref:nucleotidyltransferase domain-containing protein n=1 Tax=Desulfoscipio sp. XC116 TaxID=3144975 RepID=UPI00325B2AC5